MANTTLARTGRRTRRMTHLPFTTLHNGNTKSLYLHFFTEYHRTKSPYHINATNVAIMAEMKFTGTARTGRAKQWGGAELEFTVLVEEEEKAKKEHLGEEMSLHPRKMSVGNPIWSVMDVYQCLTDILKNRTDPETNKSNK